MRYPVSTVSHLCGGQESASGGKGDLGPHFGISHASTLIFDSPAWCFQVRHPRYSVINLQRHTSVIWPGGTRIFISVKTGVAFVAWVIRFVLLALELLQQNAAQHISNVNVCETETDF